MTSKLKPCPFCGWNITAFNEDLYRVNISGNDHWVHLRCVHCGATAQGRGNTKEAAEHQAQDRWNTRAERTCHSASASSNYFRCSECGCEIMFTVDGWKPLYMGEVNYCPNCGSKVVS